MKIKQTVAGDIKLLYKKEPMNFGLSPDAFEGAMLHQNKLSDTSRTLFNGDGDPIACAGLFLLWPGVAECWSLVTLEARMLYPLALHKGALSLVEEWRKIGLHRIQVNVLSNFIPALDWASKLGFVHEGPLHNYGPNKERLERFAIWQ